MIVVSELTRGYQDGDQRVEVLNAVSVSVASGASLAVTGPSGSGKSTLLNVIAGLLSAEAGTVDLVAGPHTFAMHRLSPRERTRVRRQHIGYVHQFFNLIPTLTVLENVLLPAHLNRAAGAERDARGLLATFGLERRLHVFPEVLSGGEQQRVAVARALLLRPAVVLADEPTGNLDPANSRSVADLLFATATEYGASLVVATHSEDVARRADARLYLDQAGDST